MWLLHTMSLDLCCVHAYGARGHIQSDAHVPCTSECRSSERGIHQWARRNKSKAEGTRSMANVKPPRTLPMSHRDAKDRNSTTDKLTMQFWNIRESLRINDFKLGVIAARAVQTCLSEVQNCKVKTEASN